MFRILTRRIRKEPGKGLDVNFYRNIYPELSQLTGIQARLHYVLHGRKERRFPNPKALEEAVDGLDVDFYRSVYPDLSQLTEIQARLNYVTHGRTEGRFPNPKALEEATEELDVDFYRSVYPDLSQLTEIQARLHYVTHGRTEGRFPNPKALEEATEELDVDFYRNIYPELSRLTEIQARLNYVTHGRKEGRFPNPKLYISSLEEERRKLPDDFDPTEYLSMYRDLRVLEQPWELAVHYLRYGRWEGRNYKRRNDPTIYDPGLLHRITAHVYDMPEVVVDSERRPTVNVLVPAFDFGSMWAGVFGIFQVALHQTMWLTGPLGNVR